MKLKGLISGIVVIIIIGVVFVLWNRVNLDEANSGKAIFKYGLTDISENLTEDDLGKIVNILDNKFLRIDAPSCGFTENVSIQFNDGQVFCIACDNCPYVYLKNKDKYINLSEDESDELRNILGGYGFAWPCL